MAGKQIAGVVVGGIILFGMYSCAQSSNETQALLDNVNASASSDDFYNGLIKRKWDYTTEEDKMRGVPVKRAELTANEYTKDSPSIVVWRQGSKRGAQLSGAVTTTAPMMQCNVQTSTVSVKFDQGPIRAVDCNMGMSVALDPSIINGIEKAKTMIVETDTTFGRKQYEFDVAGLKL